MGSSADDDTSRNPRGRYVKLAENISQCGNREQTRKERKLQMAKIAKWKTEQLRLGEFPNPKLAEA